MPKSKLSGQDKIDIPAPVHPDRFDGMGGSVAAEIPAVVRIPETEDPKRQVSSRGMRHSGGAGPGAPLAGTDLSGRQPGCRICHASAVPSG